MARRRRRVVNGAPLPSTLGAVARATLARTTAALKAIALSIEGVVVDGDPPQVGPHRYYDLNDVRRVYRRHFGDE